MIFPSCTGKTNPENNLKNCFWIRACDRESQAFLPEISVRTLECVVIPPLSRQVAEKYGGKTWHKTFPACHGYAECVETPRVAAYLVDALWSG
jgi:hypothetical protein